MTITIDLPPEAADFLSRKAAQQGQDVARYVRHLAICETELGVARAQGALRTPGLHRGQYQVEDDFDMPLPESFWLGSGGL